MAKSMMEHSRAAWHRSGSGDNDYPGDEGIQIGCLQRIATATEKMVADYDKLRRDRDWEKERAERNYANYLREKRRAAALAGLVKRLKRQLEVKGAK